jgi:predicted RNA-binding Zn-ribbon protein involved in translation (DUF1610 family)
VIKATGGNGAKVFQCFACGYLITRSDHLISLQGKNRHVFINPVGIEFDFQTFSSCDGAIAVREATVEHTWFPGYAWRFALCGRCGEHLGWYYEGVSSWNRPSAFWGILVARINS